MPWNTDFVCLLCLLTVDSKQPSTAAAGSPLNCPVHDTTWRLLLLEHHLLPSGIMDGCAKSSVRDEDPTKRLLDPICHSIIQSLSRQWPSLPALLLIGAIQRLCKPIQRQPRTDAHLVLAGWIKLLLETSTTVTGQQPSQSPARAGKRKSISSESKAQLSAEASGYRPTAQQLKACIGTCIAALPACGGQTTASVKQVASQLLQHLQHQHPSEYAAWGRTAQVLAASCHPHTATETSPMLTAAVTSEASSDDLFSAQQGQQSVLQSLHTAPDCSDRSAPPPEVEN